MHAYSLLKDQADESMTEIISRAGAGDQEAFTKLDAMFRKRVTGFLMRTCGDHWLADELTNETFMRAYKSLGNYKGDAKQQFLSFLFTISVNLLRDHLRRRPGPKTLGEDQAEQIESEYNSDESLEAKERQQMLRKAMNKLAADEAMLISLAHLKDMPADEIAKVLGKPSGQSVRAALCRAMKHLREILVQQGYFAQVVT
ncbi:MAG: sigma-70 family RNA polymerase sigma factor [Actinobacteria bacterium]|nr:sigma-70 family RNA polymerase sigma factor [Actinomycetota bacterium]